MRVPKSFRSPWSGQLWTIHLVPNLLDSGVPCDGVCDFANREILLDARLHGTDLLETLFHECLHVKGGKNHGHVARYRLNTISTDMAKIVLALGIVKV